MDFAELQDIIRVTPRSLTYTRLRIAQLWFPGGPDTQSFKDQLLAGTLMNEAEEFIDRALALFLLRLGLRSKKHSTWADVSIYYSNYFLAGAFQRICLSSFTHASINGGSSNGNYSITPNAHDLFEYQISKRNRPFNHVELWDSYYKCVEAFSWKNGPSKDSLIMPTFKHRERKFREQRNYSPGQGFQELYKSDRRYLEEIRSLGIVDLSLGKEDLDDSEYSDRSAYDRIVYLMKLLRALESARIDPEVDEKKRQIRLKLISRYASNKAEEQRLIAVIKEK